MYDLLAGIRVLDVSILAPDMLGMHLADLGADVIKIEVPPGGDHIRHAPGRVRAGTPSLSHMRWNRGRRSLALNLKTAAGVAVFLDLAKHAQVVIEGLRAGTMDKLGVGYEAVRSVNPGIVFCSISGTGKTGPYSKLGMHGVGMDAFAGIAPVELREDGSPYIGSHVMWGSRVGPLYAALATAAALVKAQKTGEGSYVEVAETDAAAFAHADPVLQYLNTGIALGSNTGAFKDGVRYNYYRTKDDKYVVLQPFEYKFWVNFCRAVGRPDLIERGGDAEGANPNDLVLASGDEALRAEIAGVVRQKTKREWVDFFIRENIPGGPMNTMVEMLDDPHFIARDNVYDHYQPEVGMVKMPTTPIKVGGAAFGVGPAPAPGQHSDEVLQSILGYDETQLRQLREQKVIS